MNVESEMENGRRRSSELRNRCVAESEILVTLPIGCSALEGSRLIRILHAGVRREDLRSFCWTTLGVAVDPETRPLNLGINYLDLVLLFPAICCKSRLTIERRDKGWFAFWGFLSV